MVNMKNHKCKALPYGALLTKVFKHFRVSLKNQCVQYIDGNITEYLLSKSISVDTTDNEESEEEGYHTQSRFLDGMENRPSTEAIPSDPRSFEGTSRTTSSLLELSHGKRC